MAQKFSIRKEPIKPERIGYYSVSMPLGESSKRYNRKDECYSICLEKIINWVNENQITLGTVYVAIEIDRDDSGDYYSTDYQVSITGALSAEPEEHFQRRTENYNKLKTNYDEWYEKNKEKVKEELQRREDTRREKAQKTLAKLKEQEEKIQQKREKLKATL